MRLLAGALLLAGLAACSGLVRYTCPCGKAQVAPREEAPLCCGKPMGRAPTAFPGRCACP